MTDDKDPNTKSDADAKLAELNKLVEAAKKEIRDDAPEIQAALDY